MDTSEILDFPHIELRKIEDSTVELTVSGRASKTFTADSLEKAVEQGSAEIVQVASALGRPVKARLTIDKTIRNTVVYPDGHAEIVSQEYLADKKPFYKKPVIVCSLIAAVLLGSGVTAWTVTTANTTQELVTTATDTPQNITVSEGVQSSSFYPLLSADKRFIIYATDKELVITDAQTGEEKSKVDISDTPDDLVVRAYKNNGFIFTWGKQSATWSEQDGLSDSRSFPSGQYQFVTRAGESAQVSKAKAAQPESIEVENQAYMSPQKGASFLYVKENKTYWASSDEGGSIITADSSGTVLEKKKLASPEKSAQLKSWAGVSSNGNILSLWTVDNKVILAEQSPSSDAVGQTATVESAEGISVTQSGNLALIGKQVINLEDMKVTDLAAAPENITAKVSGFIADSSGAKSFIDAAGSHTPKQGVLVGYNADSMPIILDNQNLIIDAENAYA